MIKLAALIPQLGIEQLALELSLDDEASTGRTAPHNWPKRHMAKWLTRNSRRGFEGRRPEFSTL
ncbi:hypothetical protein NKH85_24870 [Mesorhizobium sp. M0924]|uniref:hypothetical protein n=1 Tax=unclassified Mesorhizobium TaxID=325217 RepID=UPI003338F877